MFKEAGQWSFTRISAAILLLVFIAVTIYLVVSKFTWGNYETFAFVTVLGGTGSQIGNKFINSKYNTKPGEVGKPLE